MTTTTKLNSKLNTLLNTSSISDYDNWSEIFDTCLEYLDQLSKQESLDYVLNHSVDYNSKPNNISTSMLNKVITELGMNPFCTQNWNDMILSEYINHYSSNIEYIDLDSIITSLNTTDINIIVKELKKHLTDTNKVYEIKSDKIRDSYYSFIGYILFDKNNNLCTLISRDEELGTETDYTLKDIVDLYFY